MMKFGFLAISGLFILPSIHAGENTTYKDKMDVTSLSAIFDEITRDEFKPEYYRPKENNKNGHIAWLESLRLQGFLSMYEATLDEKYLDQFKSLGDHLLTQRDDVLQIKDELRQRIVKGWGAAKYTRGIWHNFAIHNSMVISQFARYARFAAKSKTHQQHAKSYLKESIAMVDEYNSDWKSNGGFEFYKFTPGSHKTHVWLPWNQGLGVGLAMIEITRAQKALGLTPTADYQYKIQSMAKSFQKVLKLDAEADAYWWEYSRLIGLEDFTHGILDEQFAYEAFKDGVVFNATDMVRFAHSYTRKMYRTDRTVTRYVDGRTLGYPNMKGFYCLRLTFLAPYDHNVANYCKQAVDGDLNIDYQKSLKTEVVHYASGIAQLILVTPKLK